MRQRVLSVRFRSLFLMLLVGSMLAVSCKNGGSDPAPAASLAGSYKITAYTAESGGVSIDYIKLSAAANNTCITDIVLTLNTDGTATATNPPSCAGSDNPTSQIAGTKWSVSGSTLSFTDATGKDDYAYSVAGSKLTLTQSVTGKDSTGKTITVNSRMELTKQ